MITQIYTIQTVAEALALIDAGVDNIGMTPTDAGLPAEISMEKCKEIFEAIGDKAVKVAITVADTAEEIYEVVKELNPDIIHLCGYEFYANREFCRVIKEISPGTEVLQAIAVTGPDAIDEANYYGEFCDYIILDSVSPDIDGIGAAGVTHDWDISKRIVETCSAKVILAGGLGPDNVADAIRAVKPYAVDSLTKTNKDDGSFTKDIDKVRAFVEAANSVTL